MKRRRFAVVAVVAIVAAGGALGILLLAGGDRRPGSTAGAPSRAAVAAGEPGAERVYRLSWHQEQSNHVVPEAGQDQDVRGEIVLEGQLVVRQVGRRDGHDLIGVRLAALSRHEVLVMGQALVADRAAAARELEAVEVIAELDRSGAMVAFHVPKAASDLAANLLPMLLSGLEARRDGTTDGAGWTAEAAAPFGTALTRFHRDGDTLVRERERYTEITAAPAGGGEARLESRATLELDGDGLWRRVDDTEVLTVGAEDAPALQARWELHLALDHTRPATGAAPDLHAMRQLGTGRVAPGASIEAQIQRQRIGDLTPVVLLSKVAGLGAGAGIPDVNDFVWRASGLLEAEPGLCDQLARLLVDGEIVGEGVTLAADLLSSAGTPAAMAALRKALASSRLSERPDYALILQRMSLLDTPDEATVGFAAELHAAHGSASLVGGAAAYAIGAMAGKLSNPDEAARVLEPLVRELAKTDDTQAQAHLVGALGNAGRPAQTSQIAGFAASGDPAVRGAVASALRHGVGNPEARSALVSLSGDPDSHVQALALASLRGYQLDDGDAGLLASSLGAGVSPVAASDAVEVLSPHASSPDVVVALRRIGDDTATPPRVRAEIARLLASGS